MKTQNNRHDFSKSTIVELNESQLFEIEGGTSVACVGLFMGGIALSFDISQQIF